jgi:hypothetical protein
VREAKQVHKATITFLIKTIFRYNFYFIHTFRFSYSRRHISSDYRMASADTQQMFDIPKKYRACVYDKPGSISTKIEELETPEPGAGEVLVRL